jgi:hypothetical protein
MKDLPLECLLLAMKPKTQFKITYPRIQALGLTIHQTEHGASYIDREELRVALKTPQANEVFGEWFGIQTCIMEGLYPHDVEAVLERMASGELTGTQLHWD